MTVVTVSRRRRPFASRWAYAFIAPAVVVFAVFTIVPTLATLGISLFEWNWLNIGQSTLIGLDNYTAMVSGAMLPSFWSTLAVTASFVVSMVVIVTALGLAIAVLLRRPTRLSMFGRSAIFLAFVTPQVATSISWIWMYNDRFGVINAVLERLALPRVNWLGDPDTALLAILIYSLWHATGFSMMIFIGGLASVSQELGEAARIDGCSHWQEFWYITLPELRPFVVFAVIIATINALQAFTQFFVMTGGGPGYSTATLGFQVYQQAFVSRNAGYAAALAVVLFAITAVMAYAQQRVNRRLDP
ncbi:sugar ABC transporter permease [Cryobacterium melibiosiphilum]|uniref:Sugar ABC transporter permease n=1 Tax=Cryobacterium melibiosiphilum TaxID=995039 RepID=A0A3A5MDT4_9MICO|nr:sugar ABC transporter permease [Cryobacterium melibiosiphilum]RJT87642.1 sugar ABC transporter permease [Cryobacterium melibiosiphilum]